LGDDKFFRDFLTSRLDKVVLTQDKLAMLDDPQVGLHLFSCLSSCKIIHLLHTVPFSILKPFLYQFDLNLYTCLVHIIQCSLFDSSWCQASLPFRLGGLGLCESVPSSSLAAFLGSCNGVHELASILLSIDAYQLSFPNEEAVAAIFSGISSKYSIYSTSQQDLQARLDESSFYNLFVSFGIRDQAYSNALAHSSSMASGWLKAIPRACLGLSIPG